MDKITIRLSRADADNVVTLATALRTDANPFVTRSAALKHALTMAATAVRTGELRMVAA